MDFDELDELAPVPEKRPDEAPVPERRPPARAAESAAAKKVNNSLPDREAGSRIARSRAEKKERQEQMATVQADLRKVAAESRPRPSADKVEKAPLPTSVKRPGKMPTNLISAANGDRIEESSDEELPDLLEEDHRPVAVVPGRWAPPRSSQASRPMGRAPWDVPPPQAAPAAQPAALRPDARWQAPQKPQPAEKVVRQELDNLPDNLDGVLDMLDRQEEEQAVKESWSALQRVPDQLLKIGGERLDLLTAPLRKLGAETETDRHKEIGLKTQSGHLSAWRERKKQQMLNEQARRQNREAATQASLDKGFFRHTHGGSTNNVRSVIPREVAEAAEENGPGRGYAAFGWAGGAAAPLRKLPPVNYERIPTSFSAESAAPEAAPETETWSRPSAPPQPTAAYEAEPTVAEEDDDVPLPNYDDLMAQLDMLDDEED